MFEDRLKMLRLARGLSQQETADALGMKVNTYRNYENNEREPNSTSLIKLGNYFGVTLDYLLDYHCENPQNDNDNQLSNDFNTDEILHIKKYRTLDEFGKKAVDNALDIQYERCSNEVITVSSNDEVGRIVAFGGETSDVTMTDEEYQKALEFVKKHRNKEK